MLKHPNEQKNNNSNENTNKHDGQIIGNNYKCAHDAFRLMEEFKKLFKFESPTAPRMGTVSIFMLYPSGEDPVESTRDFLDESFSTYVKIPRATVVKLPR